MIPCDGSAVFHRDHDVLGDVGEFTGQVAGVGRLEGGVGETLPGSVRRGEVFEYREAFAEVGFDRRLDDPARGLGHKASHSGKLADLLDTTTGSRIGHQEHGVQVNLAVPDVVTELLHHLGGDLFAGVRPVVENLVVPLLLGDDPAMVKLCCLGDFLLGIGQDAFLGGRRLEVVGGEREARSGRFAEAKVFHRVEQVDRLGAAEDLVAVGDDPLKLLLTEGEVIVRHLGVQDIVEDHPADSRLEDHPRREFLLAVTLQLLMGGEPKLDVGVDADLLLAEREEDLVGGRVNARLDPVLLLVLARFADAAHGDVVRPHDDVLGRADDRVAVGGAEDVVGRHHQRHRLDLRLDREREVDGHLVAVEVGVEAFADERVNPDRVPFDEHRLKRLDPHPVQGRSTVEENGVVVDHLFEDIPHLLDLPFEHLLGRLDRVGVPQLLQPADDERLEELERDFLGKTALVESQIRSDHDHRSSRVIDPLAEQVLTEPALLALDHVGERLERAVARTENGPLAAVVVEEGVDRLLKHPLLVADDDLRCVQVDQLLEPVVPVDDPTVQVVQVAGGEVARIEQNERAKVGRDHRDALENHPFRTVVGIAEALDDLEPLGEVLHLLLAGGLVELLAKLLGERDEVEPGEELAYGVGPHVGLVGVSKLFLGFAEVFLGEELTFLERGIAGVDDDVILEVDDPFEAGGLHVEQGAQAAGHRLEEPDVNDRRGQLDVAHALAADPGMGHLHAATVADHPFVLHPAVLTAGALPVFLGTEDSLAEESVLFRTVGPVVDRLRLLDLAERPATDVVRAGEADLDGPVVVDTIVRTFAHAHETLSSARDWPCRSGVGFRVKVKSSEVGRSAWPFPFQGQFSESSLSHSDTFPDADGGGRVVGSAS